MRSTQVPSAWNYNPDVSKKATRRPTPEWFKQRVRDWLEAHPDWPQHKVEKKIGAGPGALYKLLKTDLQVSGMVDGLCELMGLPDPERGPPDAVEDRIIRAVRKLSPDLQLSIAEIAEKIGK